MRKRFDKDLYDKYDKLAKNRVVDIIDKRKYEVVENPKKRGVDLLIYERKTGNHVLNIETEVKRVWKTKDFKYDTVQFPERKSKFAKLNVPTLFVMFSENTKNYLVVKDKDLVNSPLKEVPNKYMFKGEYFYQVPLKKVKFDNIKKVIKGLIK